MCIQRLVIVECWFLILRLYLSYEFWILWISYESKVWRLWMLLCAWSCRDILTSCDPIYLPLIPLSCLKLRLKVTGLHLVVMLSVSACLISVLVEMLPARTPFSMILSMAQSYIVWVFLSYVPSTQNRFKISFLLFIMTGCSSLSNTSSASIAIIIFFIFWIIMRLMHYLLR